MTRGGGWWWHRSGTRNAEWRGGCGSGVGCQRGGGRLAAVILDLIQDLLHRWDPVEVLNVSAEMLNQVQHDTRGRAVVA